MNSVYFTPFFKDNPYQILLKHALEKENWKVNGNDDGVFLYLKYINKILRYDIVHIHWTHYYLSGRSIISFIRNVVKFSIFCILFRLYKKNIVWTVHNLKNHESKLEVLEAALHKLFVKFICSKIIVHCEKARIELIKKFNLSDKVVAKIHLIPHGHYINYYPNSLSRNECRSKLDIDKSKIVFLFMGQIRMYKGILELIESFKKLARPENSLLIIVGKPYDQLYYSEIENASVLNKNIIIIPKYIPDEEVQLYFNASDIYILPYKDILTSGSAVLGMSFGKPIIMSKYGCAESMIDKSCGILFDFEDPNSLTKSMDTIINSNFHKMGNESFKKVKKFSWELIAQKTSNVYLS